MVGYSVSFIQPEYVMICIIFRMHTKARFPEYLQQIEQLSPHPRVTFFPERARLSKWYRCIFLHPECRSWLLSKD